MAKQKGNICLRLTPTPSGMVASVVYRGPQGKRTLENLGFIDPYSDEGKAECVAALTKHLPRQKRPEGASG